MIGYAVTIYMLIQLAVNDINVEVVRAMTSIYSLLVS